LEAKQWFFHGKIGTEAQASESFYWIGGTVIWSSGDAFTSAINRE